MRLRKLRAEVILTLLSWLILPCGVAAEDQQPKLKLQSPIEVAREATTTFPALRHRTDFGEYGIFEVDHSPDPFPPEGMVVHNTKPKRHGLLKRLRGRR